MMPPARQRCVAPPDAARNSSATASLTRVGICSERRKYSCATSSSELAVERDQALIAVHVGALVDGHGEVALAEQRAASRLACRDCRGHAVLVEARAGAHFVGGDEIHDQHAHRTVALRLQNETAIDLQRRAQHHREHQRFAQELGDRLRIGVPRKDFVDDGPSRTTRPRRSSLATSNGMTVSSRAVGDGARVGMAIWGSVMVGQFGHAPYVELRSRKTRGRPSRACHAR